MKRLFATILSVICLAACAVLFGCDKDVPEPENDGVFKYEYVAETDSYTVIGTVKKDDTELTIPTEYNGKPITNIGQSAFDNCEMLSNISLPGGLKSIEMGAFSDCINLKNITIPNSVTYIGKSAFWGTGLTSIEIPNSIVNIDSSAFGNCQLLTSVVIPDTVTYLGTYAFAYCENLIYIHIGAGIKNIEWGTFRGCKSLKEIYIGDSVIAIHGWAFTMCDDLEYVRIGTSVQYIGSNAFSDNTAARIEYAGTVEQWNEIDTKWFYGDFYVYCSDGIVDCRRPYPGTEIP